MKPSAIYLTTTDTVPVHQLAAIWEHLPKNVPVLIVEEGCLDGTEEGTVDGTVAAWRKRIKRLRDETQSALDQFEMAFADGGSGVLVEVLYRPAWKTVGHNCPNGVVVLVFDCMRHTSFDDE